MKIPEHFPEDVNERMCADKVVAEVRYRALCQALEIVMQETGSPIQTGALVKLLDAQALEMARGLMVRLEGDSGPELSTKVWNAVQHELTHPKIA